MLDNLLRHNLYPAPRVTVPAPPAAVDEVVLKSAAGDRVVCWAGGTAAAANRPVALLFHGNGENLETMRRSRLFATFARLRLAWLAVDYPGYGRSTGEPSEESIAAAADAALAWARREHPRREVAACGWSLGAAAAVALGARHPRAVDRLALLMPWTSLAEVASVHFPGFVVRPLLAGRWNSLAAARVYPGPALVVHGRRDRIIPWQQGQEVARALPGRVRWELIDDAGHNDLLARERVWRLLAELLR